MSDKKYEFEEAQDDKTTAEMGVAAGIIGLLGMGVKMYADTKQRQVKEDKRKRLNAERQALVQELNEYNSKFLSFLYEDDKEKIRRRIKEIDAELKK